MVRRLRPPLFLLLCALPVAGTACGPHYLSVPEEARADRMDRIETPAFSVRPPRGSWILGGTTLNQDLFGYSESCVPGGSPYHYVGWFLDATADLGEPISVLHLCRVSEWLWYVGEYQPEHVHWELSVYAFGDPALEPTESAAARAERFLSGIRKNWTMLYRTAGIEETRIDGIPHFRLILEHESFPELSNPVHCIVRFTPELAILFFSAQEPGPDRDYWVVFQSLNPVR